MALVCDTVLYAVSAKERAIDCSSTVAKSRCKSKARSDGGARVQHKARGIRAE